MPLCGNKVRARTTLGKVPRYWGTFKSIPTCVIMIRNRQILWINKKMIFFAKLPIEQNDIKVVIVEDDWRQVKTLRSICLKA